MWGLTKKQMRDNATFLNQFRKKRKKKKKKKNPKIPRGSLYVWRKKVLARDDYTCQYCGATENIHAHHKQLKSEQPHLKYELKNGIALCEHCHNKEHQGLIDYYKDQKFLREIVQQDFSVSR